MKAAAPVAATPGLYADCAQVVTAAARPDEELRAAMHAVAAVWPDRWMCLLAFFSVIAVCFEKFPRPFDLRPGH